MSKFSDRQLVDMLQSADRRKENQALTYLHQQLSKQVSDTVKRYGGTLNDAEDVLQEGLFAFFKAARLSKLPAELNAEAYLFSICKHLWFRKSKKTKTTDALSDAHKEIADEDIAIQSTLNDEKQYLMRILSEKLGKTCYQILIFFYYERRKMKEIAQLVGYENEQVAKNKKSNCMKTLKKLITQEPKLKGAFA